MEHEAALEKLSSRFGMRLDATLDGLGYPGRQSDRVRALGTALQVDTAVANALLSGHLLPAYSLLLTICEVTGQQPGYFLDEHVFHAPPGTCVVKPLQHGEDLVLRLPSEVLSDREAKKGMRYWRAPVAMGFGITAGEYLIALEAGTRVDAQAEKLYLLSTPAGLDVVRCVDVHGGRAVFEHEAANDVPLIVSTKERLGEDTELTRLVASIRCGRSLHIRA